jgi:hypothetical protein
LSCVEIGGGSCFVVEKFYKEEVEMKEGKRRVEH